MEKLIVDEQEYWNEKYWKLYHEIEDKLKELQEVKKMKDKFNKHFCKGEKVWKPICKECKDTQSGGKGNG